MLILLIVFLILVFYLSRNNQNVICKRSNVVLLSMWSVALILSVNNPFHLYPVSFPTYLLLLLFLLSFTCGFSLTNNIATIGDSDNGDSESAIAFIERLALNKFFLAILAFCDIYLFFLFMRYASTLALMSAADVRSEGMQGILFEGNTLMGLSFNWLVVPMTFFADIFIAYLVLFKRKLFPILLYLPCVIITPYINGSRAGFLHPIIMLCFFCACCPFLWRNIKTKNYLKRFIPIIVFVLVGLSVISFMTTQRYDKTEKLSVESIMMGYEKTSEQFVTYLIGPFRAFDYALENDYKEQLGGSTFGRSTLGFLDSTIEFILEHLGIKYERANSAIYAKLQNDWIFIPFGFNFAYTALFNFYMDFGILGIAIIPFLLGLLYKKICNSYAETHNPITLMLLMYLFYVFFDMFFTWRMYKMQSMVILIWLWILNSRTVKNAIK